MTISEMHKKTRELIDVASPFMDRVDVFTAVGDCYHAVKELEEEFNSSKPDSYKVEELKDRCNSTYIRLEYILCFLDEQRRVYSLRQEVAVYYKKLKSLLQTVSTPESLRDIINAFSCAKVLKTKSLTCSFDVSMEELKELKRVCELYDSASQEKAAV